MKSQGKNENSRYSKRLYTHESMQRKRIKQRTVKRLKIGLPTNPINSRKIKKRKVKKWNKMIKRKKYNARGKKENPSIDLEFQRKEDKENGVEDIIKGSFKKKRILKLGKTELFNREGFPDS